MSKTILFHGTSADHLKDVLKNGLRADSDAKLWVCSEEAVYLWSVPEIMKAEDVESETDAIYQTRQRAVESAQFALSLAKDCRMIVCRVEIDTAEIEDDDSCPNMRGSGAVCVRRNIKPSEITSIEVSNDMSLLRAYFMAMALDRDLSAVELTPLEAKIAKCFKDSEIYLEDIEEMTTFQPVTTAKRNKKSA